MSSGALLDVLLLVAAVPVAAIAAYLSLLTVLSSAPRPPPRGAPRWRFAVVIPAHDEELGIGRTVRSALAARYPASLRRVVVVADNCSDATAEEARRAGAAVLVREDRAHRGKGYALAHAFDRLLEAGWADAVVVIDADTVVSEDILLAFAARLDEGAVAVQANNVVVNPLASWRTSLMAIAFVLVNTLRSIARERMRCSVGLRGNGMCLSARVLRAVPHDAFSVVEDLEYGIRLGMAGHRVRFAADAHVASVMVVGERAARSQRRRWEDGRRRLARQHALALIRRGIAARDRVLLDLGVDLLVPPLASVVAASSLGLALAGARSWQEGHAVAAAWAWSGIGAALVAYVGRGWWLSGTGLRGAAALLQAPVYLGWKLWLTVARAGPQTSWIRTQREREP